MDPDVLDEGYSQDMHRWHNAPMRVALCLLLAASVFAADKELRHDSGKREGKKSRCGTDSAPLTRKTLPRPHLRTPVACLAR